MNYTFTLTTIEIEVEVTIGQLLVVFCSSVKLNLSCLVDDDAGYSKKLSSSRLSQRASR